MKAIELIKQYPLVKEVAREWFMDKLVKSIHEDNTVPEDFKDFMLQQVIDDDKLCIFIDSNPRGLFDLFDLYDLFIEIFMFPDVTFTCKIGNGATTNSWKTRKEAEMFAIEAAFEMLENKLKPADDDGESDIHTANCTDN